MTTFYPAMPYKAFAQRWRHVVGAVLLSVAIPACTTRSVMNFNRFDGRTDQAAAAQFQQDDAICKGEVAKAQAMAAPIYMGHSLADAMEAGMLEGQRTNALRQIMVGCMAQRGYSVTMVTVPS
ncbi:hypothetical protein ASE63_20125 [Bosea sp. Root381]|uniref:hypothetical protein n=1 Tax=Bosea sp. Root381 TaxID=1736524 RepID=UPI0006FB94F8|nr:hypothetical protein [Bosea sp. Root381]KRE11267.1 hypothetical protein ASE63_20125 [Bosea sp. Root381]